MTIHQLLRLMEMLVSLPWIHGTSSVSFKVRRPPSDEELCFSLMKNTRTLWEVLLFIFSIFLFFFYLWLCFCKINLTIICCVSSLAEVHLPACAEMESWRFNCPERSRDGGRFDKWDRRQCWYGTLSNTRKKWYYCASVEAVTKC